MPLLADRPDVRMSSSAGDCLADFVCERRQAGVPAAVRHGAKRLLLNQLTASAAAALSPEGMVLLAQAHRQAELSPPGSNDALARMWWSGLQLPQAQAAAANAHLLHMLDLGDTHLPSLGRFTAAIVPTLLAQADAGTHSGLELLEALALGLEVDMACVGMAACRPLGLGAVVARCTLLGLNRAMLGAALNAHIAEVGIGAGDVGEYLRPAAGRRWRLLDIALHCRPLPVQALAPVEAVLALRPQCPQLGGEPRRMELFLSPQAWRLLQTRAPDAADELRRSVAVAWLMGQFTTAEREPACTGSAAVSTLAARIELLPDGADSVIESCRLSAHFDGWPSLHTRVDAFLGSAGHPLTDSQLSELFRSTADDLVLPRRSGEILCALWGLDQAPDSRVLTALLRPS